jgi:hypothetical protein
VGVEFSINYFLLANFRLEDCHLSECPSVVFETHPDLKPKPKISNGKGFKINTRGLYFFGKKLLCVLMARILFVGESDRQGVNLKVLHPG